MLQKDIEAFAHITIARNYGLFEWNGEIIEINDSNRLTIGSIIPRVLSLTIPALLLWAVNTPTISPSNKAFGLLDVGLPNLILISLLLLTIDNVFKLGLISNALGLAKSLSELKLSGENKTK